MNKFIYHGIIYVDWQDIWRSLCGKLEDAKIDLKNIHFLTPWHQRPLEKWEIICFEQGMQTSCHERDHVEKHIIHHFRDDSHAYYDHILERDIVSLGNSLVNQEGAKDLPTHLSTLLKAQCDVIRFGNFRGEVFHDVSTGFSQARGYSLRAEQLTAVLGEIQALKVPIGDFLLRTIAFYSWYSHILD
jgi:hypothetical protein